MAVNPPDMDLCAPKSRCLSGSNEGLAYETDSPCGGAANVAFNPVSCDCEQTVLCGAPGECGYDITYSVPTSNIPWTIKSCGSNVCYIYCNSDKYSTCAPHSGGTGSIYLPPGRCLRKTRTQIESPCSNVPLPSGSFHGEYWYSCPDPNVEPSYSTCGTTLVYLSPPALCGGVWVGPGIEEAARVQRVKKATSTTITGIRASGGNAGCYAPNCAPPTTFIPTVDTPVWPVAIEDSITTVHYAHRSTQCDGGGDGPPPTWGGALGVKWMKIGAAVYDATIQSAYDGASDVLCVIVTAAISSGQYAKGDKIGYVFASTWGGAVGCTYNAHSITSTEMASYNCYKPSQLV